MEAQDAHAYLLDQLTVGTLNLQAYEAAKYYLAKVDMLEKRVKELEDKMEQVLALDLTDCMDDEPTTTEEQEVRL